MDLDKKEFDLLVNVFLENPLRPPSPLDPPKDDPTWEYIKLSALHPYIKNVHIRVQVLRRVTINKTRDNHDVHEIKIADDTGCAILILYDKLGESAKMGDVLQINGGYVTMYKWKMRLACRVGNIRRIGFLALPFAWSPNYSKIIWNPDPNDSSKFYPDEASYNEACIISDEEEYGKHQEYDPNWYEK
jgi:hypothetical protein